jgi:hypothetical protein
MKKRLTFSPARLSSVADLETSGKENATRLSSIAALEMSGKENVTRLSGAERP